MDYIDWILLISYFILFFFFYARIKHKTLKKNNIFKKITLTLKYFKTVYSIQWLSLKLELQLLAVYSLLRNTLSYAYLIVYKFLNYCVSYFNKENTTVVSKQKYRIILKKYL
jgi:hypothetical protein